MVPASVFWDLQELSNPICRMTCGSFRKNIFPHCPLTRKRCREARFYGIQVSSLHIQNTRRLPQARFHSARTGGLRPGSAASRDEDGPEVLVWAAGARGARTGPPGSWRPRLVVDLDYAEDSPARAYALAAGARYLSGLSMFEAQARAQRRFWRDHDR